MNTSNVREWMVRGWWRWMLPCLVALLGVLVAPAVVEAATKERIRFHVQDHAGSTMRVLTPEGFVVAKYRYSPFGEQLADKVATADRSRSAYVGGIQERNDLLYLKHRYYNPVIGRFYQPDPVSFLSGGPSQINRYAYGLNDPYTHRDPDGREPIALSDTALDAASLAWDATWWAYYLAMGDHANAKDKGIDFGISLGSLAVPYANAWILKGGKSVAKSGPIWTENARKGWNSVDNAFQHWKKHGAEFPEFRNAKQYADAAKDFLHSPPAGTLSKVRSNGDVVRYNQSTNTFGIMDANGVPRTMYRPDATKHGYPSNLDYFNAQ